MLTAKNKAIDTVRRQRYHREFAQEAAALLKSEYTAAPVIENFFMEHEIQDSQLRMIFACCQPALSEADQIALTLKTCSAFSVHEIASALLSDDEVIKKRLQRARTFIAEKRIRFDIPTGNELKRRLDTVLHTIYLIFNEGYNSSTKTELIRKDLCEEAIRLAYLLNENSYTRHTKCLALLSLLTLQVSRFDARLDDSGSIVLLEDQDRTKWNHALIQIGMQYFEKSIGGDELTEYHVEAAIAAEHSISFDFATTNWKRIKSLYDQLKTMNPSPAVLLSRAIVIGKTDGPEEAIDEIYSIAEINKLIHTHYLFSATLGELYRQTGKTSESAEFLHIALTLTHSPSEKALLQRKLDRIKEIKRSAGS